jgi:hypothetical protein
LSNLYAQVIKEFPLPHLKQWSAAPAAFTMDFGDYEESYYTVITNESDAISQVRSHAASPPRLLSVV